MTTIPRSMSGRGLAARCWALHRAAEAGDRRAGARLGRLSRAGVRAGQCVTDLVMGGVFEGSVQMLMDSTVIHLDLLTMRRRVDIDPALGSALAADLARRYSHCIRTIALHAFGSVLQRVAFDLLDRACRTQLSHGHLEAAASQQQIADGIGSARPVVAKGLTIIRARGLVDTSLRRVRIIDPVGLEALALSGLL